MTPRDLKLMSDTSLRALDLRTDAKLKAEVARLRALDPAFNAALSLSLMIEDEQARRAAK